VGKNKDCLSSLKGKVDTFKSVPQRFFHGSFLSQIRLQIHFNTFLLFDKYFYIQFFK
jgi:hypothetical protein